MDFVWIFFRDYGFFYLLNFLTCLKIWGHVWIFLDFFGFFSKLLRLQINVTEVTTEHQKWLKIDTKRIKALIFTKRKKSLGQSPPQELEVSPHMRRQRVVRIQEFL